MTDIKGRGDTAVEVSRHAEDQQDHNAADPFPPEGTDDKLVRPEDAGRPLSEADAVAATRAVIAAEDAAAIPDNHVPHKEPFDL